MSKKTAVVVGGGIAGLATSALLAKAGMDVKLFESRDSLGGRAAVRCRSSTCCPVLSRAVR